MKSIARDAGMILVLSIVMGLLFNQFSNKGIPLVRSQQASVAVPDSAVFGKDSESNNATPGNNEKESPPPGHHSDPRTEPIRLVTLDQFKRLVDQHQSIIIDSRNREDYERGHVPGAISIPYIEIENYFEKLTTLPVDSRVVVYCNNPECPLGHELIRFMSQMGFSDLLLFEGGYDGWVAAGFAVQ